MRRRRKTKYYWLPLYGAPNGGDATLLSTTNRFTLDLAGQTFTTGSVPVVANDVPNQISEGNFPLNDIIGNEYILKRIVGKVFCALRYHATGTISINLSDLPKVSVAAGFYVARKDVQATGAQQLPLDSVDQNLLYCPLNAGLTREPWIWRRQWMLGAGDLVSTLADDGSGDVVNPQWNGNFDLQGTFPWTNVHYPGVLDGPHVDAKTGRRVRQDEGLFFCAAAHVVPFTETINANLLPEVDIIWDVRCLGALRRARNRSNF